MGEYTNTMLDDMNITLEQIESAAGNLARSETGRIAMADLLRFMQREGLCLDGDNQQGVATLLSAAWGGKGQTVRDAMQEALDS